MHENIRLLKRCEKVHSWNEEMGKFVPLAKEGTGLAILPERSECKDATSVNNCLLCYFTIQPYSRSFLVKRPTIQSLKKPLSIKHSTTEVTVTGNSFVEKKLWTRETWNKTMRAVVRITTRGSIPRTVADLIICFTSAPADCLSFHPGVKFHNLQISQKRVCHLPPTVH
jgi:hypothetical protein